VTLLTGQLPLARGVVGGLVRQAVLGRVAGQLSVNYQLPEAEQVGGVGSGHQWDLARLADHQVGAACGPDGGGGPQHGTD
jgi:hypothetical protein